MCPQSPSIISRTPRAVQVMGGHDSVLDVGASSHFLGTADEHPHLPPAHLGEQLRLLRLSVGVVDKRDLLLGNTLGDELCLDIVMGSRIFYNSLSTPLFVSERMPEGRQEDVLFWQENARDDIPGNMQMILSGRSKRTRSIYVQKKESYDRLIQLGTSKEVVKPLGFIYAFSRKNTYQNEALICTNSDRIEKCEELIKALPNMRFHIAAITEMSSKLMSLSQYENVMLYPGASAKTLSGLFDRCDYYLDINHGSEIASAVKQAFLHDQLILGFKETLHNKAYVADEHVFEGHAAMIAFLNKIMGRETPIRKRINLQKKMAMSERMAAYRELLK